MTSPPAPLAWTPYPKESKKRAPGQRKRPWQQSGMLKGSGYDCYSGSRTPGNDRPRCRRRKPTLNQPQGPFHPSGPAKAGGRLLQNIVWKEFFRRCKAVTFQNILRRVFFSNRKACSPMEGRPSDFAEENASYMTVPAGEMRKNVTEPAVERLWSVPRGIVRMSPFLRVSLAAFSASGASHSPGPVWCVPLGLPPTS